MSITPQELADWYADPEAERVLLMDLTWASNNVETTDRFGSHPFRTGATDVPANTQWKKRLTGDPYVQILQFGWSSPGGIELDNFDGELSYLASDDIDLGGALIRIGAPEWEIADFDELYDGGMRSIDVRGLRLIVQVEDVSVKLEEPAQPWVIPTGPAAGDKRPLNLGRIIGFKPPLGDATTHTYPLHDGPIESIDEVRVNGVVQTPTTDYSVAQADLDAGNLVMTADPDGELVVDFHGGKDAGGAWISTPKQITLELLTRRSTYEQGVAQAGGSNTITLAEDASDQDDWYNGATVRLVAGAGEGESETITDYVGATRQATVGSSWGTQPDDTTLYEIDLETQVGPLDATEIDLDSLDSLPAYEMGISIQGDMTVREALQGLIEESCGGYLGTDRKGLFRVGLRELPTGNPVLELTEGDYDRDSYKRRRDPCLAWRVRVFSERNWSPLTQHASGLDEERRNQLSRRFLSQGSAANYATKRDYKGSNPGDYHVCSFITSSADAQTEAERRVELRKQPRSFHEVMAHSGPFQVAIQDEYRLYHAQFLPDGRDLRVTSAQFFLLRRPGRVRLEGWG